MPEPLEARLARLLGDAFVVGRELPGGGMSRVFVAREEALKRDVVVKVLPPDLVTRTSIARFEREVELMAQLQHPHILPVITAGGEGDLFYYVAPYIAGQSLRDRLEGGKTIPFDEGVRLVVELLGAVAFAHGNGVVHRDLKPGNVLLSEGHAILADFGIARALEGPDDGMTTMSGTAFGTPAYMAPEHPRDQMADLYAVAVMAYEMLVGRLPSPRVSGRDTGGIPVVAGKAEAVRAKRVAAVLAKALSAEPAKRYQTADELRHALIDASARVVGKRYALVAMAAMMLAIVASPIVWKQVRPLPDVDVDRVAVLPVVAAHAADQPVANEITAGIRANIARWIGASDATTDDAIQLARGGQQGSAIAVRLSRASGPTSVIAAQVLRGDTTMLHVSIYAPSGKMLRTLDVRLDTATTMTAAEATANVGLRRGTATPWNGTGRSTPAVLASWRALDSAEVLVQADRLADADTAFARAVRLDPENAIARFRRAEVLAWAADTLGAAVADIAWSDAAARTNALPPVLRARAEAWLMLRAKKYPEACRAFDSLSTSAAERAFARVGLGDCRASDDVVVSRAGGPQFRSGWHGAATAYESAMAAWPGPVPSFVYRRLEAVLQYVPNRIRTGTGVNGQDRYAAMPAVVGDTVGFLPQLMIAGIRSRPTTASAVRRNGARLRGAIQRWLLERPSDFAAHLLHARILEQTGELASPAEGSKTALGESLAAASLATSRVDRIGARIVAVRVLIKLGRWTDATLQCDSAIAMYAADEPVSAARLSPLIALTGNGRLLVESERQASSLPARRAVWRGHPVNVTPFFRDRLAQASAVAFTSPCTEASRQELRDLDAQLAALVPGDEERRQVRATTIVPLLGFVSDCVGFDGLADGDALASVQQAERSLALHDTSGARRHLNDAVGGHTRELVGGSTEFAIRGSNVALSLGDTVTAMRIVDLALERLSSVSYLVVERTVEAAALRRLMVRSSDLHNVKSGSATATKWAAVVDTLSRNLVPRR